ncbi:MAG: sn-glycerol-3-phosphate ABC transporter ATP-binding protein UgpC [Herpetosiphon sp.]
MGHVRLQQLTKRFGTMLAVDDLSFEVPDRNFLAILGSSGCGKTTAMRCIAGLEQPDSGHIFVDDIEITRLEPQRRDIAMVFQNYALYPHFTVYQNLEYPLKMRQLQSDEVKRRVQQAADFLRIGHLLDRKPSALSGGEQQRVALGRAIVREPRVFVMDEPLSNLDAKLRSYMRAELKALQQQLGVTTIYVTHDQAEAMTMSDQIAVMDHGRLQQIAPPAEIYNRPANRLVAGFVGSPPMNFLDGDLTNNDQQLWLQGPGFRVNLTAWSQQHVIPPATTAFTVGMRPEHITLEAASNGSPLVGEVYVSEPLGAEVIVNLRVGDAVLKVRTAPDFIPQRGERFGMVFEPRHIHGFDAGTGLRIPGHGNE